MSERPTVYADPDPEVYDKYYGEEYYQAVGVIEGEPFTEIIRVPNLSETNELEIRTRRQTKWVMVADENGILHTERYLPELHGEEMDLPHISREEFMDDPQYEEVKESMRRVAKKGCSRSAYDVEEEWRKRGGDPSFRLPKKVYRRKSG